MAHPKKSLSTASQKSSSKSNKSSRKGMIFASLSFNALERQEVEDASVEVTFSTSNPVDMY